HPLRAAGLRRPPPRAGPDGLVTPGGRSMGTESLLFAGAAVFFAAVAALYGVTSDEPAGSVLLTLPVGALALVAVYLRLQGRRIGRPRPEDLPAAVPGAGTGDTGYFPHRSAWPFVLGCAAIM